MKTVLMLSAAALAAAAPAAAQPADVGEVVVTPNRSAQPLDRVGAQVSVLDAEVLAARQTPVVSDLLAATPGVNWSRNGGVGGATQLRIRGAEADQTVVLIDGVKLNDPSSTGGGFNFADLLIGDVDRVEVLRGPQSVLWGSQAIGGVVDMITAAPTRPFEAQVSAEIGSRDTGYARAAAGGTGKRLSWRFSAAHYATAGVSAFDRRSGGQEADGYRNTGASGRANLALTPSASVDVRATYVRGRNEFDGFPPPAFAFGDTAEYGVTKNFVGYAGLNLALLDGRLKNRFAYTRTSVDRSTFDPAQMKTDVTFDGFGRNSRWEYQGVLAITEGWSAVFGAEQERSRMRSASPSSFDPDPPVSRASARINGVYGQLQGTLAKGLTVTGGLRRDDHDVFGGKTVAQAAAAWSLADGATVLRASYGEGFKGPTLFQLYSEFGNLTLSPETAKGWDAGVEQRWLDGRITASAAYFSRRSRNLIDFVSCPFAGSDPRCLGAGGLPRFGFYDNVARAKAEGIELQGSARIVGGLSLSANYTYTRTENTSPGSPNRGRDLARRPESLANLEASYLWPNRLTTAVGVRRAGASFDDAANRTRLDGYTLVEARVSYPLREGIELYARVENLGDEAYQTVRDYGQPGRSAYAGLRARF